MSDVGLRVNVVADAKVSRTKENYVKIIEMKIEEMQPHLPVNWLDINLDYFNGHTPRQMIEMGEGYRAEHAIERMQHTHRAFLTLLEASQRYSDVPELSAVWEVFELACKQWPWRPVT